jgi:hypothetical protein
MDIYKTMPNDTDLTILAAVWVSLLTAGILWFLVRSLLDGAGVAWQKLDVPIMSGFAIFTAVVTLALKRWSGRWQPLAALCLGAFLWWVLLSLATALWFPGASYLFAWPTLAGLLGLGVSNLSRPDSVTTWVAGILCSIPSLVLLPPLIRTTFDLVR